MQSELDLHLARQEMNLKVQMDLQTKLHRQLLVQRQLQHQLETSFTSDGAADPQQWQATLSLKNSLRERLTKHVAMQQEMLQHLDAIVSSEVTKPAPDERNRPMLRQAAAGGDARGEAAAQAGEPEGGRLHGTPMGFGVKMELR